MTHFQGARTATPQCPTVAGNQPSYFRTSSCSGGLLLMTSTSRSHHTGGFYKNFRVIQTFRLWQLDYIHRRELRKNEDAISVFVWGTWVCLHVCICATCMPAAHGGQKRTLYPLGLGLQVWLVAMWELRTKPSSFVTTTNDLKHQTQLSSPEKDLFFKH